MFDVYLLSYQFFCYLLQCDVKTSVKQQNVVIFICLGGCKNNNHEEGLGQGDLELKRYRFKINLIGSKKVKSHHQHINNNAS